MEPVICIQANDLPDRMHLEDSVLNISMPRWVAVVPAGVDISGWDWMWDKHFANYEDFTYNHLADGSRLAVPDARTPEETAASDASVAGWWDPRLPTLHAASAHVNLGARLFGARGQEAAARVATAPIRWLDTILDHVPRQRQIQVWPHPEAPADLPIARTGDEDWVAFVPDGYEPVDWMAEGTQFGWLGVDIVEVPGGHLHVGVH